MSYTTIDADTLREDLEKALEEVAKKYNAKLDIGSIGYGEDLSVKITLNKVEKNEYGEFVMTPAARTYLDFCEYMGEPLFTKDLLNKPLRYEGDTIRLVGFNKRAPSKPIHYMKGEDLWTCSKDFFIEILKAQ